MGALYWAMPPSMSLGLRWMPLVILGVLIVPSLITHRLGHVRVNIWLGYLLSGVVAVLLVGSLALLVRTVFAHGESPGELLRSGALLWMTNVLVFATWYWRLDAGGPHARDRRVGIRRGRSCSRRW